MYELRASNWNELRYILSITCEARGMSVISSALASIRSDLRSGCGALATGADPSRLSENDLRTARSSGLPALARNVVLRASRCTLPAALRNSATYSPPVPYQGLPIRPANRFFSPMPRLMLIERKNGLPSWLSGISIQVLSSFCQSGNRPSVRLASLITSANGRGVPGAGGAAAGGAAAGGAAAVGWAAPPGAAGGAGVGEGIAETAVV